MTRCDILGVGHLTGWLGHIRRPCSSPISGSNQGVSQQVLVHSSANDIVLGLRAAAYYQTQTWLSNCPSQAEDMGHGIVGHCGIDIRWLGVHHRAGHPPPLLERCDTHVRLRHNGTTAWTTTQLSDTVQHVKPALFCRFPGHRVVEDVAAVGLRHGHALPISILPTLQFCGLYISTLAIVFCYTAGSSIP